MSRRWPRDTWRVAAVGAFAGLLLLACDNRGVTEVTPQLAVPGATLDFGTVPVLNEKKLDVPIVSVGRIDLTVGNVKLANGDAGFRLERLPAEKVRPGLTENVVVAFVPRREETYRDTLTFTTDDVQYPSVTVQLQGQGSTRAIVDVMPATVDFGRVHECGTGVALLTIGSRGTADLIVHEVGFTADTPPGFQFVGSTRTPATVRSGGQIQLTLRYTAQAGAMGDVSGTVRLVTTDPERQEVLVPLRASINRAPIATIAPVGNGAPGSTVSLDGTGSSDPDGHTPLSYRWTLRSKPLTSTSTLGSPDAGVTALRLDPIVPGAYEVQLDVLDSLGAKSCEPARATVVATPAQKLLIELFWDNAQTDLDLHVLRTPMSALGTPPDDCYYQNRTPDWGLPMDASDDPQLLRDALTGYGPEQFGYVNPIDTTYRVAVIFENDHLVANPASRATVRVYQYGVLKAEIPRTLDRKGRIWSVLDVTWPSGDIRVLP